MTGFDKLTQKMSEISGLPPKDINQAWEKIKANRELLDGCACHNFSIDLLPDKTMGKRWKCTRCGGEVNSENKYWYELGIEHSKQKI